MIDTNRRRHQGASAPASLPSAVTDTCDAFEASFGPQDFAKGQSVAKNAEINDKFAQMIARKSTISHMVPKLLHWQSRSHRRLDLDRPCQSITNKETTDAINAVDIRPKF